MQRVVQFWKNHQALVITVTAIVLGAVFITVAWSTLRAVSSALDASGAPPSSTATSADESADANFDEGMLDDDEEWVEDDGDGESENGYEAVSDVYDEIAAQEALNTYYDYQPNDPDREHNLELSEVANAAKIADHVPDLAQADGVVSLETDYIVSELQFSTIDQDAGTWTGRALVTVKVTYSNGKTEKVETMPGVELTSDHKVVTVLDETQANERELASPLPEEVG